MLSAVRLEDRGGVVREHVLIYCVAYIVVAWLLNRSIASFLVYVFWVRDFGD